MFDVVLFRDDISYSEMLVCSVYIYIHWSLIYICWMSISINGSRALS